MKIDLRNIACFGVAGNFTGHLEQAGEDRDFKTFVTESSVEPKALFPTYIPNRNEYVPSFLNEFPFDDKKIIFPKGEQKVQIEPECAIIFEAEWNENKVISLTPILFGASNDCSIRKEGAKKISLKKNWGNSSKGFSSHLIPIDSFSSGNILDRYRIASYLIRNNNIYVYGENSAIRDYSYFYGKLSNWLIEKINNQQDFGPAENINKYLYPCSSMKYIMISVGATRYTDFGKNNFLMNDDTSVVVLYPENVYSDSQIYDFVKNNKFDKDDISFLIQKIVL